MNKLLIYTFLSTIGIYSSANAFTPWWEQPTVCRLDPSRCYSAMGAGFDTELWDNGSKCWGQKIICADALKNSSGNTPLPKKEISNTSYVNADFDTNKLSAYGDCYGQRKTKNNGTETMVNGKYVQVWCHGILDRVDETTPNGEITFGPQPTCTKLAEYGYVAVENGQCYGKHFDQNKYYIDCEGNTITPSRLIVLNGADINAPQGNAPQTMADAKNRFQDMYKTSADKKSIAFKNKTN